MFAFLSLRIFLSCISIPYCGIRMRSFLECSHSAFFSSLFSICVFNTLDHQVAHLFFDAAHAYSFTKSLLFGPPPWPYHTILSYHIFHPPILPSSHPLLFMTIPSFSILMSSLPTC
jgi:hypothetical protein